MDKTNHDRISSQPYRVQVVPPDDERVRRVGLVIPADRLPMTRDAAMRRLGDPTTITW